MASSLRGRTLNRRAFLGIGLAGVGLAALPLLQACGPAPAPTATPEPPKPAAAAPTPTPAAKPAAPTPTPAAKPAAPTATPAAKPTAAPTPAAKAAPIKPGTKIQVCTRPGTDAEIMTKSVVDFAKETGIEAEHVTYPGEPEYWAKVQAMHATKQVADVVWASVGNFHNFANRGLQQIASHRQASFLRLPHTTASRPCPGRASSTACPGVVTLATAAFSTTSTC